MVSNTYTSRQRRLVLEGQLIPPCTAEVERAWKTAGRLPENSLEGRKLVVDLTKVVLIGPEREEHLFKLMRDGRSFCCGDVLTKHVVEGTWPQVPMPGMNASNCRFLSRLND